MKTSKIMSEVDSIMTKQIKKNEDVINNSKIEPLTDDYQFCTGTETDIPTLPACRRQRNQTSLLWLQQLDMRSDRGRRDAELHRYAAKRIVRPMD